MALVSGNRSAQDWCWWHQPGSGALGSRLENGAAGGQRAHGRTSQSARAGPPGGRWKEEGDGEGSELATGPGGVALSQRGSDELDQMDDALVVPSGQGALPARPHDQEDSTGRRAARAGLFAQG